MATIALVGSRSIPRDYRPIIRDCVRCASDAGYHILTGCAPGVDAIVRDYAPLGFLSVFFVGDISGSWPLGGGGPRCFTWAGGDSSVPFRARLARRTAALVSFLSSAPGSPLVAFVTGGVGSSPGSWLAVRLALAAGLPVVVVPCGCSVTCFPSSLAGVGSVSWSPFPSGPFSAGFRAVPAQLALL